MTLQVIITEEEFYRDAGDEGDEKNKKRISFSS
jgi:hypothetical protein